MTNKFVWKTSTVNSIHWKYWHLPWVLLGIEEINVKEHESWQWVLGNVFRSDKLGFRCQISSWNDIESNLKDSRYFFHVVRGNSVVLSFWVISAVRENIGQWNHIYNFSSIFFLQNEHVRIIYQCTWPRCGIKMDICSDMERHVRSKHLM